MFLTQRALRGIVSDSNIRMVYFLACEVGGSKVIDEGPEATQIALLRHNGLIYETVLPWLRERRIPFVFTSSYVVNHVRVFLPCECS